MHDMTDTVRRDSRDILTEAPPQPADARIAYGPEPLQFADLRLPIGAGPWPLAIVLHGGGWQANFNLIHAGHLCVALRVCGIATWNVEYRRVGDPGGGWPGSFEDVLRAVEHVQYLPEVNSHNAVLVGHSAGAHLALLAAAETGLPVVAIAAASDFDLWEPESARAFLGDTDRDLTSPRRRLPLGVRQVLVHGTDDDQVPFWLSRQYVEAAGAVGDDAELVALPTDGHFEPVDPKSSSWPRVEEAIQNMLVPGGAAR
jgi:acetyl esterase/lipase